MKNYFTFILICSFFSAKSQSYYVSQIPYNPMPWDSGINVVSPVDDVWSAPIPIGFDFYFFGKPQQELLLGTNCIVTFTTSLANAYCPWVVANAAPSPLNIVNSIMFPWQDVNPSFGGLIHHQVYGIPPNRKFVLSFDTVPYYSATDSTFTGQLILYETTGNIEMHIHHKASCTIWNNGAAILGVQDTTGNEAKWASNYNYPVQWTASDEAWLFSPDSNYAANLDRISGRVFSDMNQDCQYNGADYPLMNKPVIFDDGAGNNFYSFTDMQGYYSKLLNPGTYSFTTQNIANQYYNANCPSGGSYSVTFAAYNDSSDNNLFADTIVDFCSDLSVNIWAHGEADSSGYWWDPLGVCDTAYIELSWGNGGTVDDSTNIILTLNDSVQILNSPLAYTSLGNNQYSFNMGWLAPGSSGNTTIMIQDGCDTIGTMYCFDASIAGAQFDCQNYNNADNICLQIGVPFDPNAMYVSSTIAPSLGFKNYLLTSSSDNLNYFITFQNTGSATAHDVVVKTVIDPHLDATTVTPGISDHNYNWLMINDTLIFVFSGIELPDSNSNESGSHAFVRFKIQQQPNNIAGTIIPQSAAVYFDYLSAVATNSAIVEIEHPEGVNTTPLSTTIIYPNPANDKFTIISPANTHFVVHDIFGKEIFSETILRTTDVDVSAWPSGVYLISIQSGMKSEVRKFVKD